MTKVDLKSSDIAAEKRAQLKQLFPEVFNEDTIDFEQLKRVLGKWAEPQKERFGLNWPGKADCMKIIQQPSVATLKPIQNESVNFDDTQNLFIEGDNLEVLKLLQKSYFGKVKMIYIDPPYNTGKEFIYPDKYSETLETYLSYTGQVDKNGHKFSTNTEVTGRYHSNWLSMMYPRLYLARNLLREDGVIFISIDDNEQANLKKMCDEVFGEENFEGFFVINAAPNARDYGCIGKMHEYCALYTKDRFYAETYMLHEEGKEFKFKDKQGEFNIHPLYNSNVQFTSETSPTLFYPFYVNPQQSKDGFHNISLDEKCGWIEIFPPPSRKEGVQFVWRWGKKKSLENLNKEIIGYKTNSGEFRIVQKMRHSSKRIRSLLTDKQYSSRKGTAEVEAIFNKKHFSFPKPLSLLKDLILTSTKGEHLILDFFAGSATTAHAVMQLNAEEKAQAIQDGNDPDKVGNRKFIMVQLPEPCDKKSEALKAGYPTITEIAKERVRRAAKKIKKESNVSFDLGFKVFKLDSSNFKLWESDVGKIESLEQQLLDHVNHINDSSSPEDILYELLLKSGYSLTPKIEVLHLGGKDVFSIDEGKLLVCLDEHLNKDVIDAMAECDPQQVICLDAGFNGNDQLKANAVLTFKARDQEGGSEIMFRTV